MAHNIGRMFYSGERPWHGLGKKLTAPANIATAMVEGGLDFTVSLKPIVVDGEPESPAPTRRAVVRDDREPGEAGRVLGVVHPNFQLLQNKEAADLFDSLYGRGREVYTTGGYLKQGEVMWLQAKLAEPIVVGKAKDSLTTYLLFSNSHDGSYPIDIRLTTTRVVCNNTLNIAMKDKDKARIFRRGHSSRPDVLKEDAQAFFAGVQALQAATQQAMDLTAQKACDEAAFGAFILSLLPLPAQPNAKVAGSAKAAWLTRRATVLSEHAALAKVFQAGYQEPWGHKAEQPPAERTFWGALNAVTAWVDHLRDVEGERFTSTTFGNGAALKSTAFELAVARCTA